MTVCRAIVDLGRRAGSWRGYRQRSGPSSGKRHPSPVLRGRLTGAAKSTKGVSEGMAATVFDYELAWQWRRIRQGFAAVKAGQAAGCRLGRLDGRDVAVFGFEEAGGFRPVVLVVDPALGARLKDVSTIRKEFMTFWGARSSPTVVSVGPSPAAGARARKTRAARGAKGPRSAGAKARRPATHLEWVKAQFDRMVDILNGLDDGWAHTCRYAHLGGDEVMVIGFWVPEPVRAGEGTRLRFEPALVRVDGAVERRLTDIREITLEDEEDEDLGGN